MKHKSVLSINKVILFLAVTGLIVSALLDLLSEPQTTNRDSCILNLRMIDSAKVSWILKNTDWTEDNKPTEQTAREIPLSALAGLLKGGTIPICPDGGTYNLGNSLEDPTCSLSDDGHHL